MSIQWNKLFRVCKNIGNVINRNIVVDKYLMNELYHHYHSKGIIKLIKSMFLSSKAFKFIFVFCGRLFILVGDC